MSGSTASAAEERVPRGRKGVRLTISGKEVRLTNLRKVFWPASGRMKGDLLRFFYDRISDYVIPHLRDWAMVMNRYPDGIRGKSFYMKRTLPTPRSGCPPAPSSTPPATSSTFPWWAICRLCCGSSTSAVSTCTPGTPAATTPTGRIS